MNGRCVFGAQYKQEDKEIMLYEEKVIETIPVGPLGLIPLKSCTELGNKVDRYLVDWRRERESEHIIYHRFHRLSERFLYYQCISPPLWFRRRKGNY